MKITVWNIKNDNGAIIHNHIENGWSDNDFPKPLKMNISIKKAWENMKWFKKYAYLVNDVVVYI